MAATVEQIKVIATRSAELANRAKSLKYLSAQMIANVAAVGINWASPPEGLVDPVTGKIIGMDVKPAQVKLVLDALVAYATLWDAHGPKFEDLAKPVV